MASVNKNPRYIIMLSTRGSDTPPFCYIDAYTMIPVNKEHSREPENVPFISSCPLYTG